MTPILTGIEASIFLKERKNTIHPCKRASMAIATTMCTGSESNVRSLSPSLGFEPVFVADYVHVEDEW